MKKVLNLLIIMLLTLSVATTYAQKKQKKTEDDPRVKELIESKDFTLKAQTAFPQNSRSISLDTRYQLTIKGDSIYSYLPYFGRAYRLPYGGGEGLIFDGILSDYSQKPGKKGATDIKFKIRTKEDSYNYSISIYGNGAAMIRVSSDNKQGIDFSATMDK